MSDYSFRPGGSLKLKGRVADGGIKKKKKSSKSQDKDKEKVAEREKEDPVEEPERIRSESPVGSSGRNSPAASSSRTDRKTKAEKRFEEVQRKRLLEKVARQAHMTHKDRVHEFNQKLEALSEHHDIPKVGPG
ncbi:DUF1754-domain-containing protein [Thelephora terrestris]|uniref:DUF1754-domain-containing protein n=1 Tax=Thelephora terrestris TaxID=56493 RepID=A0A9P6HGW9_9AGAM|nr:DUF1754-domain-containing protein [Thelephora terrestris]